MKVAFHHSDKPREQALAQAFGAGVRAHGHDFELRRLGPDQRIGDCDLACMVGVKSAELWRRTKRSGTRTLYLDKGYSRHRGPSRTWEFWRVSLDRHHPTLTTLDIPMPSDRLEAMGLEIKPWRRLGCGPIIIAGSSAKYHDFYGLPDPTRWAAKIIRQISKATSRHITYRPKPSWRDAVPIEGAEFSPSSENLGPMLENAHAIVTHGSNACFDAMVAGVPSIILGEGVALAISDTDFSRIDRPGIPKRDERRIQLLANLAWHQYTEAEMAEGVAWNTIQGWLNAKQAV